MKHKKGNILLEGITIIIVLFVLALVVIAGTNVYSSINNELQDDNQLSDDAKVMLEKSSTDYPTLFDGIFIFILVGLWITSVAFAYFIDTSPVFFVVSIILLVVVIVVSAIVSNTYQELAVEDGLDGAPVSMPMTYFIMSHLVETLLVITFSIAIALFAKTRT